MTAATVQQPTLRELVAEEVRVWLARRRLSGAELARRIGRSQTFVAKRLDGRQAFDVDDLELVAQILEVPVETFFTPRRRGVTGPYTPEFRGPSSHPRPALTLVRSDSAIYRGVAAVNTSSVPATGNAAIADVPRWARVVNHAHPA